MNKKAKFLSVFIITFLVGSFNIANLSQGVIASNQLKLTEGSYVEGRLLYTNSTAIDVLISYPSILVEDIFKTTDVEFEFVQILYKLQFIPGMENPLGIEWTDIFELTHLVFTHNRTTFLSAARVLMKNSTYSSEASILGFNTIAELQDFNNTKLTINDVSYLWGDITPTNPLYYELFDLMFIFMLLNLGYGMYYKWSLLGISPSANTSEQINYVNTDTQVDSLGNVINKPQITSLAGPIYNTTHVKYECTSLFGFWDAPEVDAYYEAETGLLIKMVETDGIQKFEFLPTEVNIEGFTPENETNGEKETDPDKTFTINNSILGISLGLTTMCLFFILRRRKKLFF